MPFIEIPALYLDTVGGVTPATRPTVFNRDPGPAEVAVPVATLVALDVVDLDGLGVDKAVTDVYVNGVLAFDGSQLSPGEFQTGFDGPGSALSALTDGFRITIDPTSDFGSLEIVTIRVVSDITGGGSAIDLSWSFTIEDTVAPVLVNAQAISQTEIQLEYSEPVKVTDANGFAFVAVDKPAVALTPTAATASGVFVTVTVDTEQSPGQTYQVTITGVADITGNTATDVTTFTGFVPATPDGRTFDIRSVFPQRLIDSDPTGEFNGWLDILQEVLDSQVYPELDRFEDTFDFERAPSTFLDLLLADLGNPFDFDLTDAKKRKLASLLVDIYKENGTENGIIDTIRFFVGVESTIEAYNFIGAVLDVSKLNVDWTLGPGEPRLLYSFAVITLQTLTDEERAQITSIVEYMKPAHTHFVGIVEVVPPTQWVMGTSFMGGNTVTA